MANRGSDGVVMHQANRILLQHPGIQIATLGEKVVIALEKMGNTSSASAPLAFSSGMRETLPAPSKPVLAGVGKGSFWATTAMKTERLALWPLTTFAVSAK